MAQGKPLFAIVRGAECEALKLLSGNAAKLWIAIRYGRREGEPFPVGCRDFSEWGLGRDAAARALHELVDAGLMAIVERGAFGRRGRRTVYAIVHTRAHEQEQSGITDNKSAKSPELPTTNGKTVRNCRQQTGKQSEIPDTPKDTSSTSSQKSKEEEVSVNPEAEAERESRQQAFKESMRRIGEAAKAAAMSDIAFIQKAGGREPADLLARSFERGNLSPLQLRARLAEGDERALEREAEGPTVLAFAIGGAF